MPTIAIIVIAVIILFLYFSKQSGKPSPNPEEETEKPTKLPVKGFYKPKWLFTYNEKDAYRKLKTVTDKYGLTLLAKVRLFDLVEPVKNNPKYKTYLYKIQSKHVDFVICDDKLVARCMIELDDSSHERPDRQKRDQFVDEVLSSTGYQILHIRAVNVEELEPIIAGLL